MKRSIIFYQYNKGRSLVDMPGNEIKHCNESESLPGNINAIDDVLSVVRPAMRRFATK